MKHLLALLAGITMAYAIPQMGKAPEPPAKMPKCGCRFFQLSYLHKRRPVLQSSFITVTNNGDVLLNFTF